MNSNDKIRAISELAQVITSLRSRNKTIVHCHGVFDLLHIGHIRHFEQARSMGDVLVVTLTPDRYVDKGPDRPAFPEDLRAEALASLNVVDYVAINEWPTAEETLRILRPDVYVKGSEFKQTSSDMTGKIGREEQVVREIGAELRFTEDIVFSSSNLINRHLSNLPKEIDEYLKVFRRRYSLEHVQETIDSLASLKVLVVGDAILDEYQYCEPMGKSSKDPILAMGYQSHELFAGGVLAIANHLANFAGAVDLVTVIGERESHEEFIRANIHPKVAPRFFVQPDAPTIVKRRFIDSYSFNKLFEVYVMDSSGLPRDRDSDMQDWIEQRMNDCDLVIAADFGHGAISQGLADSMCEQAPFLAVNTQANAGNRGFHSITKYKRADYVCLAEHEIRLETRDLTGRLQPMMDTLAARLACERFVVTRGRSGCLVRDQRGEFVGAPAFAQRVVDRVGAGDAFLSVTSLAARRGIENEVIGFLGNVVGCLAVETVGNMNAVDKLSVKKYVTALMK